MPEIEPLPNWEAFEGEIHSLFERVKAKRSETQLPVSTPIFRGHAAASWRLTTTLERYSSKEYPIEAYYKIMRSIKPALESFMEKRWTLEDNCDPIDNPYNPPQGYPFMIYLRHHGFPSPLLDWTMSPYVAAFFAFEPKLPTEDENVAIYSFIEYWGDAKSGSTHVISTIGSYVLTDRRHHIQQCRYTFAIKKPNNEYVYCDHEEAHAEGGVTIQNILTKFLIPRTERPKVLAKLDLMNINAYSLYGDEENLMKLLAYREIENPTPPASPCMNTGTRPKVWSTPQ
jgi:FRG domain